jgi:hypothetical protein
MTFTSSARALTKWSSSKTSEKLLQKKEGKKEGKSYGIMTWEGPTTWDFHWSDINYQQQEKGK